MIQHKTKMLCALVVGVLVSVTQVVRAVGASETVLYVSPTGSDAAKGDSPDAPFATLVRARDELRNRRSSGSTGPFAVELLPGRYDMAQPLVLGPEDSGKDGAPVTFRAQKPQTAILAGAKHVKISECAPVKDPKLLERLDPAARGKVVSVSIEKLGLRHAGPYPDFFHDHGGIFEVFDEQGRLPLSRWPNAGFTTIKSVLKNGDEKEPGTFEYRDARVARWVGALPNVWIKGQWRVGWQDPAMRVAAIDPQAGTITFATGVDRGIGCKYTRPKGSGKEPWYALNLVEEIDRPGEWAIDFASKQLFIWPRHAQPADELIFTQNERPFISGTNVSFLRFENLVLEHSLGDGMIFEGIDASVIAGCVIRNLGGRGIVFHGVRTTVQSCDIHHVGRGAIYVSGGDRKTLTRSGNAILNNHLHNYGVLKSQYSAAVHVGVMESNGGADVLRDAVGIRMANNVIHHAPRDAFLYSGNDNLYEYNEIYYCGFNTKDTGAFYSWSDWTMRGNVIRYNFMHNTVGGVNPDDGASGNIVYGNIFSGPSTGVWIASGPDNSIRHNIFIKEEGSVFGMDDRGVSRGYATNDRMIKRVKELDPSQEPWKSAHPEMATMLENRPDLPWRTEFIGNLIVSQKPAPSSLKMKKENMNNPALLIEKENLVVSDDPGFVNAASGNYRLREDSKVFKEIPGFQPIPFEKIGLYKDEFRPKLPGEKELQRAPEDDPFPKDAEKNFST